MTPDRFRYTAYVDISTHTLTWSVTGKTDEIADILVNFNSHAHVERDACIGDDGSNTIHFNSHAHVERD